MCAHSGGTDSFADSHVSGNISMGIVNGVMDLIHNEDL